MGAHEVGRRFRPLFERLSPSPRVRASGSGFRKRASDEGTGIGSQDLQQVQDHPPSRAGSRDLRESATQATAGITRGKAWHALVVLTYHATNASISR